MNDGGPAFPHTEPAWSECQRCGARSTKTGMRLLDWFAGQALAMPAILDDDFEPLDHATVAKNAYDLAEAMLAERARRMSERKE